MNRKAWSFLHRALGDQNAQVLPMMAVLMTLFFGMGAMVLDVGDVYIGYNELQASTQAAALAGAAAIGQPTLGSPTTIAETYGAESGEYSGVTVLNSAPILQSVTMTPPVPECNSTLQAAPYSVSCVTYTGESGTTGANAMQVIQTAKVRTYFAAFFGHPTVTLTAIASAARAGALATPHNVAVIIDSTQSMQSVDSNCAYNTGYTRLQCALAGVQTLMENMSPCYTDEPGGCGTATNGVASPSVDRVSLFTFPNLTTTTAPYEFCDGGNASTTTTTTTGTGSKKKTTTTTTGNLVVEPYTFPSSSATSLSTVPYSTGSGTYVNVTYQLTNGTLGTDSNGYYTGYVNDFKTSDALDLSDPLSSLNSASDMVLATGAESSCPGMYGQGGEGTYYAGAIYAAMASLYAEQQAYPGSQSVMILLSDGDASATESEMDTQTSVTEGSGKTATTVKVTPATSSGSYPSWEKPCQQAITASQTAAAAPYNIEVYSIAYGSESGNCSDDTITPCYTMQHIASNTGYFYSDDNQSGTKNTCVGTANTSSNLETIFKYIASDFTTSYLVPNSAFGSS